MLLDGPASQGTHLSTPLLDHLARHPHDGLLDCCIPGVAGGVPILNHWLKPPCLPIQLQIRASYPAYVQSTGLQLNSEASAMDAVATSRLIHRCTISLGCRGVHCTLATLSAGSHCAITSQRSSYEVRASGQEKGEFGQNMGGTFAKSSGCQHWIPGVGGEV